MEERDRLLLAAQLLLDDDRLQNEDAHEMLLKTLKAMMVMVMMTTMTMMGDALGATNVNADENGGSAPGSDDELKFNEPLLHVRCWSNRVAAANDLKEKEK